MGKGRKQDLSINPSSLVSDAVGANPAALPVASKSSNQNSNGSKYESIRGGFDWIEVH